MTLLNLALFFIGAGLPSLTAGIITRFIIIGKKDYDAEDNDNQEKQPWEKQLKSTETIGYTSVSIGILIYIAYVLLQTG